ncbi:MAG: alpha/beta hydrolase [Chloroflexi bacterium]|nr:alpha/beta hydrolase [Chloroflexota bacterium]
MPSVRRLLPSRPLTATAAALAGAVGLAVLVGEYGHRQITASHRSDFRDDPSRWGIEAAEDVSLTTRDGLRVHAWLFRAPTSVPSVIVSHGHGGNKQTLLPVAKLLSPFYNVLLLDHRGHGESEGRRTTIGYEERLDVLAAVEYLVERRLGPIGLLGMSMGAATAILAAAEDDRIAAVVADSPFGRLRWAVAQVARLRGYPARVAPMVSYLGCRMTALRLGYPMTAFDPVEVVDRIAPRPLLLIHGGDDEIIPVASAHALLARAGEPKELWLLDGLQHCRALDEAYEPFRERVLAFFGRWLQPAESTETRTAS